MGTRTHVEDASISASARSTTGGQYGVSPESPDGSRICYASFPELLSLRRKRSYTAELRVCDRDGTNHRTIAEIPNARPHNGLLQRWVGNDAIAVVNSNCGGGDLSVVDVETGETVVGPRRWGRLGHDAHDGRVLYTNVSAGIPDGAVDGERGLFELDCTTGERRLIVSREAMRARTIQGGHQLRRAELDVNHMQYAPSGERVSFLVDTKHVGVVDRDGSDLQFFPGKKPMHHQWYDDRSLFGHTDAGTEAGPSPNNPFCNDSPEDNKLYRWDLDEQRQVERLAGYGCHPAASPDRALYASEDWYFSDDVTLRLYRRGEDLPAREVFTTGHTDLVWDARLHVNPAFSRDGSRLYYTKPVGPATTRLCYTAVDDL